MTVGSISGAASSSAVYPAQGLQTKSTNSSPRQGQVQSFDSEQEHVKAAQAQLHQAASSTSAGNGGGSVAANGVRASNPSEGLSRVQQQYNTFEQELQARSLSNARNAFAALQQDVEALSPYYGSSPASVGEPTVQATASTLSVRA